MSWLLSLGIWLGFRELYTENQACGGNFLVLKITLLSSITKRQLFVSLSCFLLCFLHISFCCLVDGTTKYLRGTETKEEQTERHLVSREKEEKRKGCELMLFFSGIYKSYVKVSKGETKQLLQ